MWASSSFPFPQVSSCTGSASLAREDWSYNLWAYIALRAIIDVLRASSCMMFEVNIKVKSRRLFCILREQWWSRSSSWEGTTACKSSLAPLELLFGDRWCFWLWTLSPYPLELHVFVTGKRSNHWHGVKIDRERELCARVLDFLWDAPHMCSSHSKT